MAGESPGRAEQQELSGEGTGGGAEDPRLTVFRGVVGAPRSASEPATGEPEFAPEPPEAEGAPEPDPSASGTPDDGADVDGGAQDATPDAEDAPPADDAGDGAESRTGDAVAEEAGAEESATDGDADGDADSDADGDGSGKRDGAEAGTVEDAGEEPAADGTRVEEPEPEDAAEPEPDAAAEPEPEPEDAAEAEKSGGPQERSATGEAGRGEEPSAGEAGRGEEPSAGADAEAEPGDAPAGDTVDQAPEEAEEDTPEDAPEESRDDAPSDGPGGGGAEGPSKGPGGVKGGPGAREASGGGHDGPRAGEGTLTLRAPRTEGAGTPVRDRTMTLRAPSASAPVATPPRPSGTFVPLRTDDRPTAAPRAPMPAPTPAPTPAQGTRTPQTAEPGAGSRTKQMPLPPDPDEPLRLLAELTNTPPPPQTPLRTTVRRVKIWTPLVLLLIVAFCVAQALRPLPEPELESTAETSYTFEGDELALPWPSEGQAVVEAEGLGRMGEFGEQKPTPIASVAKVMTTYVILRDHPIKKGGKGETVEVDQKAEDQYHSGMQESESVVPVTAGQKLSEYEALEAVMLPSANNIARLLARWDAGSEAAFVKKMNAVAKELGMDDTTYTDPSGLEATTVSTASDQVKLGHAAMKDKVFAEIATKIQYTDINGNIQKNYNQLAGYNDIVGIKTGTSTKAGGNLLFAAYRKIGGTRQLIVGAMLDQQKAPIIDTVLGRSHTLIDGTRDALASASIIKKGDVVGYVDDGLGGHTPVVAGEDVTAIGWAGLKVDISVEAGKAGLPHTANAGDKVGELVVGKGDSMVRVPVLLETALVAPSFGSKLTRVA
ncbi:D-alanyl-D-alanine carboxypeptidase [Actinacidiphila glaucinigra]|uniref:D-alanyl-D-alanine carboxypeptidase n=1 Tax=Actinacidiphila glaucinigra TaxID=235986 RepID=UPI0035E03853